MLYRLSYWRLYKKFGNSIFSQDIFLSIFCNLRLNCCVRDGNRCTPQFIVTKIVEYISLLTHSKIYNIYSNSLHNTNFFHFSLGQALVLLVLLRLMHYYTSTCNLSPRSLQGDLLTFVMRYLILRWASHLYAFSVYPIGTWLPSYASGDTTGAPAVPPPRSSRTRGSSSQISYACDR